MSNNPRDEQADEVYGIVPQTDGLVELTDTLNEELAAMVAADPSKTVAEHFRALAKRHDISVYVKTKPSAT